MFLLLVTYSGNERGVFVVLTDDIIYRASLRIHKQPAFMSHMINHMTRYM